MNWYLAKVVYRIICGDGAHKPQFEEQLRLIEAETKGAALEKALVIGQSEEVKFLNNRQQLVHWKFINVSDLYQLNEVVDGTELYSRIEEQDNADLYEEVVHKKAGYLLNDRITPHLQHI